VSHWQSIAQHITAVSGEAFEPRPPRFVGGGCINQAVTLSDEKHAYFVKLNSADRLDMFEAEAEGLAEMAATRTIRVPRPVCSGTADGQAYLVMEHIDLGRPRGHGQARAGRQLAEMHRNAWSQFGWRRDNTIGSTPQPNTPAPNWAEYWRGNRLGFQLALAHRNGYGGRLQDRGRRLLELFPKLLDHAPQPSLLHGDLWGGNMSFDTDGDPVIYDPAVYYGDREADLAMTELFGGFGGDFYAAYEETWPLAPGYPTRKLLYNLYHVLNHLNLFGSGYLGQAQGMIDRLLAELR
jgi:fructosamine-3-kinase